MTHIALNAHLLSPQAGYRAAGIHNVIHHLLHTLPQVAPPEWRFTAFVGRAYTHPYERVTMRHSRLDTQRVPVRIFWEQVLQPAQLLGFDLYHAPAYVAPLLCAPPIVVTIHDLSFIRYPETLSTGRRLYLRLFTALTCQRARVITAMSESTASDVVSLLGIPREKIIVTWLGYDAQRYRVYTPEAVAAFRAQKGLPERFWLFVGTIEPRKNLPMLLEAYARLPRGERLPLVLGGGAGWGMAAVQATIQTHGLQDEVRLVGFIPIIELPLWYNSAETFIYPSVFEGFGMPVLEAMACGTPVLTSNVSSLPEVAQDAGACLPPDDREAWADALRRAATDAAWREQARRDGLRVAQTFSWQQTARHVVAAYARALK